MAKSSQNDVNKSSKSAKKRLKNEKGDFSIMLIKTNRKPLIFEVRGVQNASQNPSKIIAKTVLEKVRPTTGK